MTLEISLKGRRALVTAASGGIGLGVAKVLASAGASVVIVARNLERLERAKREVAAFSGQEPFAIKADLTKEENLAEVVRKLEGAGPLR
ncbi:SDR family NAD(P)-dependent oxidoreductase [Infirmifilum sp. SLHALR2]|nr:MAG: hypothetical protein B7L53_06305 [Thermofilum sp. NZ13]